MPNKKIFKNLYSKKINKDNNYQEILKSIESENTKINLLQKILVPICSILIICTLIFININEKSSPQKLNDINDYHNSINESYTNTSQNDNKKVNIDYQELIKIPEYHFLKELIIPTDLNNVTFQAIYVEDTIYNYEFIYEDNNSQINLSFSKTNKPLRYITPNNNQKTLIINNHEISIYQQDNTYITIFNYHNIYFDIETNNITNEQLHNLLQSIIK